MKKLLLFVFACLCVVSLTACGGNSVAGAGEEFKLLTLEDLKNNSSKDAPIEVSFWHSFGHSITSELNPLIEEFEELYASQGIYIDVKATSTGGGYDGLRSRVNLGTKSNSIPTMLLGYPDHFADYINSGILLPLDEFANAESDDINVNLDDFFANYLTECYMDVKGKNSLISIPFNKSTEVMYYNASACEPILKELGYITYDETTKKYSKWENPTWEQVWAVSDKLKTAANSANGLSWTYNNASYKSTKCEYPTIIDSAANFFITATRQWGGEYTRATGEVAFNNEKAIEAQNYFRTVAFEDKLWQLPNKLSQSYGSYVTSNLEAFISIGSTAGVNNNASTKFELKITNYPQVSYGEGATNAVIQQGTNAAILSANSNNLTRLAAWLLIRHLTSTDITTRFAMGTGYLPVRVSAKEGSVYSAFLADEDNIWDGNVAKVANAAFAQQPMMYTDPAFSGSSIVRDKVDTMIISIYCNNKDVSSAIQTAYTELERLGIKVAK